MENKMLTPNNLKEHLTATLNGRASDFAKADFWHYTSLENAKLILDGDTPGFLASSLALMNDLDERQMHENEKKRVFSLCFCNTKMEKIPMWYMYSDLDGEGVALGFTPGKMRDFINSIERVYPFAKGKVNKKKPLRKGVDFEIQAGWIAYYSPTTRKNVRFKGEWYDGVPDDFEIDNYFIKSYPWYYEDEFRIVIMFKNECNFDQIYIELNEKTPVKLMIGPGFNNDKSEKSAILEELKKSKKISGLYNSKLKVNMKLAKRHLNSFITYIVKKCKE